jgi:hypothetical protein
VLDGLANGMPSSSGSMGELLRWYCNSLVICPTSPSDLVGKVGTRVSDTTEEFADVLLWQQVYKCRKSDDIGTHKGVKGPHNSPR